MESTSSKLVPSPSSPGNVIVSPETFSHHSSPAKISRIHSQHHVTLEEPPITTTSNLPISISTLNNQLVPSTLNSNRRGLPLSISPISATSRQQQTSPTQHLSVLYHSHHHHHLHPVLTGIRRPSRLPEIKNIPIREIKP